MENLNTINSDLWLIGLNRTQDIEDKIKKTKMNCLTNDVKISGKKNDILLHLKGGPSKNLINSFFKYKTNRCDLCNIVKDNNKQLDRAHCNLRGCSRSFLLEKAVDKYYIDESTPLKIKEILIEFIRLHTKIPLYILCKSCHIKYDSLNF